MRDDSANFVSHNRTVHRPVEQPQAHVYPAKQAAAKLVNSFEANTNQSEDEMVVKRSMTLDRFLPSACPTTQQQQT